MGSPEIKLIPTEFEMDVDATVSTVSTATVNATTSSMITGSKDAPISMRVDPLAIEATLRGDPQAPLAARAGIDLDLRNLPHLTFDQITELLRTATLARSRIRFPVRMDFGLSVFPLTVLGIDALSFSVCGEPQVVRDDCVPDCEDPCREGDDRPEDRDGVPAIPKDG